METAIAKLPALVALALLLAAPAWGATPVRIVAAENFYGDIARQIGGRDVTVRSILSNPDQDPHLFEVDPAAARAVARARIVIYNGLGYDAWMKQLLGASRGQGRQAIVVADLVGGKPGDNPHIWYDPKTMPALAHRLAQVLTAADPAHADGYARRLAQFRATMRPLQAKIAALRRRLAGTEVTATEPVFGYMLAALGLRVRNAGFQLAVMNGTEPSASQVAGFERDLRTHRVRLLVYNRQASDPIAARMERIARTAGIPVLGASETEPPGTTYQQWMLQELDALEHALAPGG